MTDIDEAMLIALVDGELDEVTRRRVERAVAEDPALAQRVEDHRLLKMRLGSHYAPLAEAPIPAAMRAMLADSAKVVPLASPSMAGRRNWMTGVAIAASLVLGLGIGHFSSAPSGPVAVRGNAMVAQGSLASALDTQLASAQDDAPVRIGISFRRKDGGWCRSFDGAAVSGVACREDGEWRLKQAIPGSAQTTEYRQASSSDPRVTATIDALIDGTPADAAQEAAAKASGWR